MVGVDAVREQMEMDAAILLPHSAMIVRMTDQPVTCHSQGYVVRAKKREGRRGGEGEGEGGET
jgi:hypothetical protein